jgi:WD40 repeat protein
VTPNGQWALLAVDDSPRLHLWDLQSGVKVRHLDGHRRTVSSVAVTPDGRRALSGSHDQTLRLWDLESGAELRRFEGHEAMVKAVALTSDGRRALSGSNDRTLRLWDLEDGAELAAFHADAAIHCCAVAQDRNRIVAGDDLGRIHVLDILD